MVGEGAGIMKLIGQWPAITNNMKRYANILQQLEELSVSPDSCTIIKNKSARTFACVLTTFLRVYGTWVLLQNVTSLKRHLT
jgi:hypothetical protein